MADNIRPALYGSKYSLFSVNKASLPHDEIVTIAGKYCETGDKLVENVALPMPESNDLIAIPVSGAYNFSMSSNYNVSLASNYSNKIKWGSKYFEKKRNLR